MKNTHWSQLKNSIEDYISPEYYNILLKDYIFNGVKDTNIFLKYINRKKFDSVLELGSGSGRATDIFISNAEYNQLELVDQSKDMIKYLKDKYKKHADIKYYNLDHVTFMKGASKKYDLVYSLWSLSHSIHSTFHKYGIKNGKSILSKIIINFIKNNVNKNGSLFIIHFDSMSDEQSILMKQWRRVFPTFKNFKTQSPSKLLLDKIFLDLDNKKEILLSVEHLKGKAIIYKDDEDLLEIFMNMHLETFFNKTEMFETVKNDILRLSNKYKNLDGSYSIIPECYIYKLTKL